MELAEICGGQSQVKASFGNITVEYDSAMPLVKISARGLGLVEGIEQLILYYTGESYYRSAILNDLNIKIELHEGFWNVLQHYKKSLVDYIETLTRKMHLLDKNFFDLSQKIFELYKKYRRPEGLRQPPSKVSSWLRRFSARLNNTSNSRYMEDNFPDLSEELERMDAEKEAVKYFENAMRYGHKIFDKLYRAGYDSPNKKISRTDIYRRIAMLGLSQVTERIINSLPDIKRLKDAQIDLLEGYNRSREQYASLLDRYNRLTDVEQNLPQK